MLTGASMPNDAKCGAFSTDMIISERLRQAVEYTLRAAPLATASFRLN